MPDSASRLVIVVDSKDSKREVDSLDKSLGNAEKQGDKTSKTIKKMGGETKATTDLFSKFKDQMNSSLGNTQIGSTINDVTQKVSGLRGSVALAAAGLAGLAVGGFAATIAGLSAMAIQSAKADAEMLVLANRANVSTTNFQVLSHAAEQLGITQDGLAQSLADAQEKLGEFTASGGGGEAADFFDALKNNTKMTDQQIKVFAKTLQGKDGVEALQLMKDKLDSVGASAQEQRFVFESLGNDLGNLLPLFENGGELLNRYGDALEEAGVIKSKEAIEQSRLLAAQTKSVQTRFEGFKTQLASQMMPVLNSLLNSFLQGADDGNKFGSIIQSVGTIAKGVAVGIIGLASAIQVVSRLIQGFMEQAANAGSTYSSFIAADGVFAKGQALVNGFKTGWNIASDTVSDSMATIKDSMKSMNDVFDASAPKLDKLGQLYYDTSGAIDKTNKGLKVNAKDAKDAENAAKKAAQEAKKHAQELMKIQEEQYRIRYEYANKSQQVEMDLQKEIERLQKYGMTQFISMAIQKVNEAKLINDAQLAYDLYSFKMNEQEKLTAKTRLEDLRISKSREYNEEEKALRLKALKQQYDYESNLISLAAEQRKRTYEQTYSNSLKDIRQAMAIIAVPKSQREGLSTYFDEKNALSENDNTLLGTNDALKMQLEQREITTLEYNKRIEDAVRLHEETKWKIQQEYAERYTDLQRGQYESQFYYGEQITGSMVDMLETAGDKQSAIFKAMFAANKAFAIAQSLLSIQQGIAQASANPFPYNLAAMATVAAATASIISNIQSVSMTFSGKGFATGGYTGDMGRGDVAGVVHGQEYVLNAAATKRVGVDTLNAINSGGSVSGGSSTMVQPVVNVTTLPGTTADVTTNTDGSLDIRIQRMIEQSWNELGNPSSKPSKAMKRFTTARPSLG